MFVYQRVSMLSNPVFPSFTHFSFPSGRTASHCHDAPAIGSHFSTRGGLCAPSWNQRSQVIYCLVAYLPLWKIWVRQLGWWHSQTEWKNKIHVPNHQPVYGSCIPHHPNTKTVASKLWTEDQHAAKPYAGFSLPSEWLGFMDVRPYKIIMV